MVINLQMNKLSGKVMNSTGPRHRRSEPLPHTDGKSGDVVFNASKPQRTAVRSKGGNARPGQLKALLSIVSIAAATASLSWHSEGLTTLPKCVQLLRNTAPIETHVSEPQTMWSYDYNRLSSTSPFDRCLFWHGDIPRNMKAMFKFGYHWQRSPL